MATYSEIEQVSEGCWGGGMVCGSYWQEDKVQWNQAPTGQDRGLGMGDMEGRHSCLQHVVSAMLEDPQRSATMFP